MRISNWLNINKTVKRIFFSTIDTVALLIQLCHLDQICISCHSGHHKGAEACYFDGRSCHCHIWDLLGYCLSCLRLTLHNILQHWFRPNCLCQHNDSVQFNCQPVRLRLVKSTVQREIEGNDVLHLFRTAQGASYPGTAEHRTCQRYNPPDPPDPHYRTFYWGSGSVLLRWYESLNSLYNNQFL